MDFKDLLNNQQINPETGLTGENTGLPNMSNVFSNYAKYIKTLPTEKVNEMFRTPLPISEQWNKGALPEGFKGALGFNTDPNDLMALQQSTLEKLGNATAGFATKAVTTFLDGTYGFMYGVENLVEAPLERIKQGKPAAPGLSDFVLNDFSRNMVEIQNKVDELTPILYTEAEKNASLGSQVFGGTGSQNFWFDKIYRNAGFAVGAAASMMFTGGLGVGSRLVSGGKTVAQLERNVGSWVANNILKNPTKVTEALQQISNGTIKASDLALEIAKDAKAIKYGKIADQLFSSVWAAQSEARFEGINTYNEFKEKMLQENPNINPDELDKLARGASNMTFLLNMAILTASNFAEFGNLVHGSSINKNALSSTIKKSGLLEVEGMLPTIGKAVGKTAKDFVAEGLEEALQSSARITSEEFYKTKYNSGDTENNLMNFVKSLGEGVKYLGTDEAFEEFIIGGLTSLVANPMISSATSKLQTGKFTNILPFYSSVKEEIGKRKETQKLVDYMNNNVLNKDNFKKSYQSLIVNNAIDEKIGNAASIGDIYEQKNLETDKLVNNVTTANDLNRLNDLIDLYEGTASKTDNDELAEEVKSLYKDKNQNHPFYTNDQEWSNDEIANYIKKSAEKTKDKILSINKIYNDIRTIVGDNISRDALVTMTQYAVRAKDADNRIEELETKLNKITGNYNINVDNYNIALDKVKYNEPKLNELISKKSELKNELDLLNSKSKNKDYIVGKSAIKKGKSNKKVQDVLNKLEGVEKEISEIEHHISGYISQINKLKNQLPLNKDEIETIRQDLGKLFKDKIRFSELYLTSRLNPSKLNDKIERYKKKKTKEIKDIQQTEKNKTVKDELKDKTGVTNSETTVNGKVIPAGSEVVKTGDDLFLVNQDGTSTKIDKKDENNVINNLEIKEPEITPPTTGQVIPPKQPQPQGNITKQQPQVGKVEEVNEEVEIIKGVFEQTYNVYKKIQEEAELARKIIIEKNFKPTEHFKEEDLEGIEDTKVHKNLQNVTKPKPTIEQRIAVHNLNQCGLISRKEIMIANKIDNMAAFSNLINRGVKIIKILEKSNLEKEIKQAITKLSVAINFENIKLKVFGDRILGIKTISDYKDVIFDVKEVIKEEKDKIDNYSKSRDSLYKKLNDVYKPYLEEVVFPSLNKSEQSEQSKLTTKQENKVDTQEDEGSESNLDEVIQNYYQRFPEYKDKFDTLFDDKLPFDDIKQNIINNLTKLNSTEKYVVTSTAKKLSSKQVVQQESKVETELEKIDRKEKNLQKELEQVIATENPQNVANWLLNNLQQGDILITGEDTWLEVAEVRINKKGLKIITIHAKSNAFEGIGNEVYIIEEDIDNKGFATKYSSKNLPPVRWAETDLEGNRSIHIAKIQIQQKRDELNKKEIPDEINAELQEELDKISIDTTEPTDELPSKQVKYREGILNRTTMPEMHTGVIDYLTAGEELGKILDKLKDTKLDEKTKNEYRILFQNHQQIRNNMFFSNILSSNLGGYELLVVDESIIGLPNKGLYGVVTDTNGKVVQYYFDEKENKYKFELVDLKNINKDRLIFQGLLDPSRLSVSDGIVNRQVGKTFKGEFSTKTNKATTELKNYNDFYQKQLDNISRKIYKRFPISNTAGNHFVSSINNNPISNLGIDDFFMFVAASDKETINGVTYNTVRGNVYLIDNKTKGIIYLDERKLDDNDINVINAILNKYVSNIAKNGIKNGKVDLKNSAKIIKGIGIEQALNQYIYTQSVNNLNKQGKEKYIELNKELSKVQEDIYFSLTNGASDEDLQPLLSKEKELLSQINDLFYDETLSDYRISKKSKNNFFFKTSEKPGGSIVIGEEEYDLLDQTELSNGKIVINPKIEVAVYNFVIGNDKTQQVNSKLNIRFDNILLDKDGNLTTKSYNTYQDYLIQNNILTTKGVNTKNPIPSLGYALLPAYINTYLQYVNNENAATTEIVDDAVNSSEPNKKEVEVNSDLEKINKEEQEELNEYELKKTRQENTAKYQGDKVKPLSESEIVNGRKNTEEIIDSIEKNFDKNSIEYRLWAILKTLVNVKNIPIIAKNKTGKDATGKNESGGYRAEDHIALKGDTVAGLLSGNIKSFRALLHELIHEVTSKMIDNPSTLTNKQQIALSNLKSIYEELVKEHGVDAAYGFTNFDEFMAELLTNPSFQSYLTDKKGRGKNTNMFKEILNNILDMIYESLVKWAKKFNKAIPTKDETGTLLNDAFGWAEELLSDYKYENKLTKKEIQQKYQQKKDELNKQKTSTTSIFSKSSIIPDDEDADVKEVSEDKKSNVKEIKFGKSSRIIEKEEGEEDGLLRVSKTFEGKEDIEKSKQYVKETLGLTEEQFKIVKSLIQGKAFGGVKNAVIYLYENAEVGTTYHEVFHYVSLYFLTDIQREELYNEVKNDKYFVDKINSMKELRPELSGNDVIEEVLAEEFRDFVLDEGKLEKTKFKQSPKKYSFFKRIFDFIKNVIKRIGKGEFKNLLDTKYSIEDLFNKIHSGNFANRGLKSPIRDTQLLRTIKNSSEKFNQKDEAYSNATMKYLTAVLFTKVFKDNNLYEVVTSNFKDEELKDNIENLYNKLNNVLKLHKKRLEAATDEEDINYLNTAIENVSYAIENFYQKEGTLERFLQHLKRYDFEFVTEERIKDDINNDETTYDGGRGINNYITNSSLRISAKASTSKLIKFMLGSLVLEKDGDYKFDDFGYLETIDFSTVFGLLLNKLENTVSMQQMEMILNDLSKQYKDINWIEPLINRLKLNNITNDNVSLFKPEDLITVNQFVQAFGKNRQNMFLLVSGKNGYVEMIDSNENSVTNRINVDWQNQAEFIIKNKDLLTKNEYYDYNKIKQNLPELVDIIELHVSQVTANKLVRGLELLGINIPEEVVNNLSISEKDLLMNKITKIFTKIKENKQPYFFTTKTSNEVGGDFKFFTKMIAKYGKDFYENQYINTEGNLIFLNTLNNRTTTIINRIKWIKKISNTKEQFYNNLKEWYPNLNAETNPVLKHSIVFNSLYTTDINYNIFDGLREQESGRATSFDKFDTPERLWLWFSCYRLGLYGVARPADNSLERFISFGNLFTATSTTQDYVNTFIDYLKDELEYRATYRDEFKKYHNIANNWKKGTMIDIVRDYGTKNEYTNKLITDLLNGEPNVNLKDFDKPHVQKELNTIFTNYINEKTNLLLDKDNNQSFIFNKLIEELDEENYKNNGLNFGKSQMYELQQFLKGTNIKAEIINSISKSYVREEIERFFVSDFISRYDQQKLFTGDIICFKGVEDKTKRDNMPQSTKEISNADKKDVKFEVSFRENFKFPDGSEELYDNAGKPYFRNFVTKDANFISELYTLSNERPDIYGDAYLSAKEEDDGYTLGTLDWKRQFSIRNSEWTLIKGGAEEKYQYLQQKEMLFRIAEGKFTVDKFNKVFGKHLIRKIKQGEVTTEFAIKYQPTYNGEVIDYFANKTVFNSDKPQGSGVISGLGHSIDTGFKTSVFPMLPTLYRDFSTGEIIRQNMYDLNVFMTNNSIGVKSAFSAVKASSHTYSLLNKDSNGKETYGDLPLYNYTLESEDAGKFEAPEVFNTTNLNWEFVGKQLHTGFESHDENTFGTQFNKQVIGDTTFNSAPKGFKELIDYFIENKNNLSDNEIALFNTLVDNFKDWRSNLDTINNIINTYISDKKFTNLLQDLKDGIELAQMSDLAIKYNKERQVIGKRILLNKLGLKETEEGYLFDGERNKLINALEEEAIKRGMADNVIDSIKQLTPKERKLGIVVEALVAKEKVENILMAMADKLTISRKLFGKPSYQVSATMMETGNRRIIEKNGKKYVVSSELNFYGAEWSDYKKNENGEFELDEFGNKIPTKDARITKVKSMEVYIPSYFGKYFKQGDDINKLIKDKKVSEKLFNIIGFRIPTQSLSSIESIKIKGFLPSDYGDVIVLPSEIVIKAGSDFDIDKLNLFIPNFIEGTDKPIYIDDKMSYETYLRYEEELFESKIDEMLFGNKNINNVDYVKSILSKDNLTLYTDATIQTFNKIVDYSLSIDKFNGKLVIKELRKKIKEYQDRINNLTDFTQISSYQNAINELNDIVTKLTNIKFGKLLTKDEFELKQLDNKMLENWQSIITHPANFKRLIASIDSGILKSLQNVNDYLASNQLNKEELESILSKSNWLELLKEKASKYVEKNKKATPIYRINEIDFNNGIAKQNMEGAGTIGIAALVTSYYIHAQRSDLYLAKDMVDIFDFDEKKGMKVIQQVSSEFNLPHNRTTLNEYSLDNLDKNKEQIKSFVSFGGSKDNLGNPISNNLGDTINATVDNAKNPILNSLNWGLKNFPLVCMLLNSGCSSDVINFFTNQPIIKQYNQLQEVYESNIANANEFNKFRKNSKKTTTINGQKVTVNIEGLETSAKKQFFLSEEGKELQPYNVDYFNEDGSINKSKFDDYLKKLVKIIFKSNNNKNLTDEENSIQLQILNDYLRYIAVQKYHTKSIQSIKLDTNPSKTITELFTQLSLINQNLRDGVIGNYRNLVTGDGFMNSYRETISDFINYFSNLFIVTRIPELRDYVKKMINNYMSITVNLPKDRIDDIVNKFKTDFITFLVLNTPVTYNLLSGAKSELKVSDFDNIFAGRTNEEYKLGFDKIKDVRLSLPLRIQTIKNILDGTEVYPDSNDVIAKYGNNKLIQYLIPKINDENIRIMDSLILTDGLNKDTLLLNELTSSWRDLLNETDWYRGTKNNLGLQLFRFLMMQSGVTVSPMNFAHLIPAEFYSDFLDKVLSQHLKNPDINNMINIFTDKFKLINYFNNDLVTRADNPNAFKNKTPYYKSDNKVYYITNYFKKSAIRSGLTETEAKDMIKKGVKNVRFVEIFDGSGAKVIDNANKIISDFKNHFQTMKLYVVDNNTIVKAPLEVKVDISYEEKKISKEPVKEPTKPVEPVKQSTEINIEDSKYKKAEDSNEKCKTTNPS